MDNKVDLDHHQWLINNNNQIVRTIKYIYIYL